MTSEQVIADVKDIVDSSLAIFGKLPYKDYTFLVKVQPQTGSGGVEHLNSTRITVGENDFVNQTPYRRFLFVAAHEYFHLWNVKRIRPAVLGPFDYTHEVNTHLLWAAEGLTSYYANLLLLRDRRIHRTRLPRQRRRDDRRAAACAWAVGHEPGRCKLEHLDAWRQRGQHRDLLLHER